MDTIGAPAAGERPDPRMLVMIGEINLDQWRCIAELVDNCLDNFIALERAGGPAGKLSHPPAEVGVRLLQDARPGPEGPGLG